MPQLLFPAEVSNLFRKASHLKNFSKLAKHPAFFFTIGSDFRQLRRQRLQIWHSPISPDPKQDQRSPQNLDRSQIWPPDWSWNDLNMSSRWSVYPRLMTKYFPGWWIQIQSCEDFILSGFETLQAPKTGSFIQPRLGSWMPFLSLKFITCIMIKANTSAAILHHWSSLIIDEVWHFCFVKPDMILMHRKSRMWNRSWQHKTIEEHGWSLSFSDASPWILL